MARILSVLAVLAVLAAILTPETQQQGGGLSSYSTGPDGASIAFELAQRMGWRVMRRETPFDSTSTMPTVEVVVGPRQALGRHEVHRLLENVRRGGGLVFTLGENDEFADSIGIAIRTQGRLLLAANDRSCFVRRRLGSAGSLPPTVHELVWRRPPPGPVRTLMRAGVGDDIAPVAIGFPFGRGRIAVIAGEEVFANETMRNCQWGADVLVARAWEYMRAGAGDQPLVFDEFHHGRGVHGGSVSAVTRYLSRTSSGRFFATLLAAGILLLFALAPRPIIPREPERIARRSPLEHADALGRAYSDVRATRTAALRLVGGLRRRIGRAVGAHRTADERAFLEAAARKYPSVTPHIALLQRALREQISPRELARLADAIEAVEAAVSASSSLRA
jgi:hypothetical protein